MKPKHSQYRRRSDADQWAEAVGIVQAWGASLRLPSSAISTLPWRVRGSREEGSSHLRGEGAPTACGRREAL